VELAKLAQSRVVLLRFDYISTCHVCGRRRGSVPEESLDDGYGFFNHYERSKFEAERLVRASGLTPLPTTIQARLVPRFQNVRPQDGEPLSFYSN